MPHSRRFPRILTLTLASALVLGGLSGCKLLDSDDDELETPTLGNRTPILSRISTEVAVDPQLANITVVVPPKAAAL